MASGSAATTPTRAERPNVAFGFERIIFTVPSRMSPRPSGRSGMMPGRGGGGL
jgi:hypothetical protein